MLPERQKTGVTIVTGATSGIGRLVCEDLLRRGHRVVGVGRRRELLEELRGEGDFFPCVADLSDPTSAAAVAAFAAQQGPVTALVNVAGYGGPAPVEATSDELLRPLFETNFFAPYALIRAVLPQMRERGSGTIVNVLSVCSVLSVPGLSAYCSSKFALHALTEALRDEVGPLGIRIVSVLPGFTKTNAWEKSREIYETYGQMEAYRRVTAVSVLDLVASKVGVAPERVSRRIVKILESRWSRAMYVIGIDGHLVNLWGALPGVLRRFTMHCATSFLAVVHSRTSS